MALFFCVRCIAVIASTVTIAPNNTTKVAPNQPKPNITESSVAVWVADGIESFFASGSTGAGLATGVFVATESEEAALVVVLLDAEVPEEEVDEVEVELEELLFVDLFSSEGEGVDTGASSSLVSV